MTMRWYAMMFIGALQLAAQFKEPKPGFNLFSPQQDVQMGKEAAAQVEKSMPVVHNEELTGYLTRIGSRLARSKHAGTFPFRFSVINDKSINAFALPGVPIYVNTGLLGAVERQRCSTRFAVLTRRLRARCASAACRWRTERGCGKLESVTSHKTTSFTGNLTGKKRTH